ncbi:hypothetical protein HYZ76_01180 [Candidatus Falkowbacteria bacterium]|nr:hypothetical protein [Candidatus Falkowbacteria bacterium]
MGFTLVESTIAIFILLVGLLAVMQFFPLGIRMIGDSQDLTIATNIALSKIEELVSTRYEDLGVGTIEAKQRVSSDPSSYLYDYQRQTAVELVDSDFNTSVSDEGLKKITVTVFWDSAVGAIEKSTEINTVIADY